MAAEARGERGYALVAAVTAVAAFAYLAFQVLAANQGAIALQRGREDRARLLAAADAGLALAIHALAADDRGVRWSLGRSRRLSFAGFELDVEMEDELAKVPLNTISDDQARALFQGAGAQGEALDALVAEFREWVTDPATGVQVPPGRPPSDGRPIRGGPMLTLDELALLQDMTPSILAAVTPVVTLFPDQALPFAADRAAPLARLAMAADATTTADQAQARPSIETDRPEIDLAQGDKLLGDPVTIQVTARARDGSTVSRRAVVELTGDPARPYWIRFAQ